MNSSSTFVRPNTTTTTLFGGQKKHNILRLFTISEDEFDVTAPAVIPGKKNYTDFSMLYKCILMFTFVFLLLQFNTMLIFYFNTVLRSKHFWFVTLLKAPYFIVVLKHKKMFNILMYFSIDLKLNSYI